MPRIFVGLDCGMKVLAQYVVAIYVVASDVTTKYNVDVWPVLKAWLAAKKFNVDDDKTFIPDGLLLNAVHELLRPVYVVCEIVNIYLYFICC